MTPRVTIGISTRNRPESLRACVESLRIVAHLAPEVLVYDDGSDEPAELQLGAGALAVRVIRDASASGIPAGRNRLVRAAAADCVLMVDDDTRMLSARAIEDALAVLERDASVGAVALAQAEADGQPWPVSMQPSSASMPAIVPAFIGYAHMVRRTTFLELGGYRELFTIFGEEKEFCLRLIERGLHTVHLPGALIAHVPDPNGRSQQRYLRYVVRNDCLQSLYNDPALRLAWVLPARYLLYFRMRRQWNVSDPWGWAWVAREIVANASRVLDERRPVSRRTLARWQALRRAPAVYVAPDSPHAA